MKPAEAYQKACDAKQNRLAQCALSILLTDEKTGESVRVEIAKENGSGWLAGSGELLNWFCEQVPQFRGMLGDSLPDGRHIYALQGDRKLQNYAVSTAGGKRETCAASVDLGRQG
jgi:hypothetical protein